MNVINQDKPIRNWAHVHTQLQFCEQWVRMLALTQFPLHEVAQMELHAFAHLPLTHNNPLPTLTSLPREKDWGPM